jgi:hypothetical protein
MVKKNYLTKGEKMELGGVLIFIIAGIGGVGLGLMLNSVEQSSYKIIADKIREHVLLVEGKYQIQIRDLRDDVRVKEYEIKKMTEDNETLSGIFRAFKVQVLNEDQDNEKNVSAKTLSNFV